MIRVDVSGAVRSLRETERDLQNAILQAVRDAVNETANTARTTTLFQDQSGALRGSIHSSVGATINVASETTSAILGSVEADAPHAHFVEAGTGAHEIHPRNGRTLSFIMNGERVFRSSVMHPGTQPRPFMTIARDRGEVVLGYGLEVYADRAIEKN